LPIQAGAQLIIGFAAQARSPHDDHVQTGHDFLMLPEGLADLALDAIALHCITGLLDGNRQTQAGVGKLIGTAQNHEILTETRLDCANTRA
jgi:hypothetical protein